MNHKDYDSKQQDVESRNELQLELESNLKPFWALSKKADVLLTAK